MSLFYSLLFVIVLAGAGYYIGHARALKFVKHDPRQVHSRPNQHGWYVALWTLVPATLLLLAAKVFGDGFIQSQVLATLAAPDRPAPGVAEQVFFNEVRDLATGAASVSDLTTPLIAAAAKAYAAIAIQMSWVVGVLAAIVAVCAMGFSALKINADFRARTRVEQFVMALLVMASVVAILTTLGIVASLIFESIRFFGKVPITEFLFGVHWSPQTALRADQVGSSGAFGAVPLFVGTFLISAIAMIVAVPIGLLSAIYLTQYATPGLRKTMKPLLEILAGVPTVVYGFFAALTVAPAIRDLGENLGLNVASESALAAGLVMGVMIIPFMSSLSDDAITAVPQAMKDGSLAMGATPSETIRKVLIPAALPGIVGGFLLAMSRAIGETMIVVMAAGLAANLTLNPLNSVTTVTAQIVALLTGDQEFDSPKTLSAFALGLVLFVVTLCLNIYALRVVRKYREAYE